MQELYELPDRDRVCRAFAFAALQTWSELRDFNDLGEDSITDYRLLQLKRMCPDEINVIKFNKQKQEPRTGADWEWWFGSGNEWFSMRVQAKRINIDKLEYEHLDYTIGKSSDLQVDRLISDAKSRDLYPMYCFYNYWPSRYSSRWPCGTFAQKTELWGASISDAVKIQDKVKSKAKRLQDIEPISFPLMCLACCKGHADTRRRPTLPHRARGIARILSDNPNLVPALKPNLPAYITQGTNAQVLDAPAAVLDLDGILIVEENPNIYGEG
jgi:hypothetical protein